MKSISDSNNKYIKENIAEDRRSTTEKDNHLFSVVIYISDLFTFDKGKRLIESLVRQDYDNFEVIVTCESSGEVTFGRLQGAYRHNDKIVFYKKKHDRSQNEKTADKVSAILNEVLNMSAGVYTLFLHKPVVMAKDALKEMASVIDSQNHSVDFLYFDEDYIDAAGMCLNPLFKTNWSPNLLVNADYIKTPVFRTDKLIELGMFDEDFSEANSIIYDMTLRYTENYSSSQPADLSVVHVEKVLLHNLVENLIAGHEENKLIKEKWIKRNCISAVTERIEDTDDYRMIYKVSGNPIVSIIIPSKDHSDILERCIKSLKKNTSYREYEVIVVDNGSSAENRKSIKAMLTKYGCMYIYENMPFNFSKMCNMGVAAASGDYYLFLNDDIEVNQTDWIERLLGQAQQKNIGAVGAKLLYPNTSLMQHAGIVISGGAGPNHCFIGCDDNELQYMRLNRYDYDCVAVTGACLLVSRGHFEDVMGYDESFPITYNDVDLCMTLTEKGYYNVIRNDVILYHHESLSRGLDSENDEKRNRLAEELKRLYTKHPLFNNKDPYMSRHIYAYADKENMFFKEYNSKEDVLNGLGIESMNEATYAAHLFADNFKSVKDNRIVLYGKGPITDAILRLSPDFNIVGIMDKNVTSGFIYGLPAVTADTISDMSVDIIVCASRPNSTKAIFERIGVVCSDKHVMLYSLDGQNLFEKYETSTSSQSYGDIFRNAFRGDKYRRIVIYGKGIIAKNILDKCPDYNIIGIMDKKQKAGNVYGKPVLDYEEVLEYGADLIVTATKDQHVFAVVDRIREFCSYNKIGLYDYKGDNLSKKPIDIKEEFSEDSGMNASIDSAGDYFSVSERSLKKQIESHDIITFDIFDTLIMRKTLNPLDVFDIMESELKKQGLVFDNFRKLRVMAQETGVSHPNIYEVYTRFQELTGISDFVRDNILNLELEIEKKVLIRREKMVSLMEYAISMGKKVFIISDMYLTTGVLEDILSGLGIAGYEKMYISCDYRTLKSEDLFKVFLNEQGLKSDDASKVLHIGDNEISDFNHSKANGLDAFLIRTAKQMLDMSNYATVRSYLRTLNERSMVGLVIARIFNDPFALYKSDGRVSIKSTENLGYAMVAPLISSLMLWLIGEVKDSTYDKMLFSARDGYLLDKLYKCFTEHYPEWNLPQALYFMMSRRMIIGASVYDEDDLYYSYKYAPRFDIEKNFHFEAREPYAGDFLDTSEEIRYKFWLDNKDEIYEGSRKNNENFHKYLDKCGISQQKRYAFFDFVSLGSCQDFLERNGAFDFDAYYACFRYEHFESRKYLKHKEWLYINARETNKYTNYCNADHFYKDYLFLESIMTSDKPSLSHFDDKGNPVYDEEQRTKEELRFMKKMHVAIQEFFKEYISDLWVEDIELRREVSDMLYHFRQSEYSLISDKACVSAKAYDDLLLEKA